MSTSFIEEANQSKIDLCSRLLDDQNELQVQIQQPIKNYGKDSAERRHREGYFAGKLEQFRELWQQVCDLDEEVQKAALPTGSDYASRLVALKKLIEKYQKIFLDNNATSANIKIPTGDQVKRDSAIDTVIRRLQRR